MADPISLSGLAAALLLPWVLGSVWVQVLLCRAKSRHPAIILGHGYLVGLFLTTVFLRIWGTLNLPLTFWPITGVLFTSCLAGVLAIRLLSSERLDSQQYSSDEKAETWQRVVIGIFLVLIAQRLGTLGQELALRPLFAWDAWMNWAPRAIVWFESGSIFPFVSPDHWLKLPAGPHTLNTWDYPPTIPLIQLWTMLGIQTSDHSLIYLPWLLILIAMCLALFGHLRLLGCSTLAGVVAAYILCSIPYVDVHVALAGYADLWQAVALGLTSLALYEWQRTRSWPYAALTVFLAVVCTQIKNPGIVLGAIVLALFILSIVANSTKVRLGLFAVVLVGLLYIVLVGVNVYIPGIGKLHLSTNLIEIPGFGGIPLAYSPTHNSFLESFFIMLNWSLLWYILLAILAYKLTRLELLAEPSPDLLVILLVTLFTFLVLNFTERSVWATDLTTLNRALIYPIPVVVFYVVRSAAALVPGLSSERPDTPGVEVQADIQEKVVKT